MKFKVGDRIKNINGSKGVITGLVKVYNSTAKDTNVYYQVLYDGSDLVPDGTFFDIVNEGALYKESQGKSDSKAKVIQALAQAGVEVTNGKVRASEATKATSLALRVISADSPGLNDEIEEHLEDIKLAVRSLVKMDLKYQKDEVYFAEFPTKSGSPGGVTIQYFQKPEERKSGCRIILLLEGEEYEYDYNYADGTLLRV